ncbi:MAG: hypothetical protein KBD78_08910 [Oligoflexales bacterium]|nr:hypothetical protein [Oligoflexales bacterium]
MRKIVPLLFMLFISRVVFATENIIEVLKSIPVEKADWNSLDGATKDYLERQAQVYLDIQNKKYDAYAVKSNYVELLAMLVNKDFNNPAYLQLIKYYDANLKQFNNEEFGALNPELKRAVMMLYLIRLADWRLIAANYNGFNFLPSDATVMAHKDWDGVSPLDDMPMPDIRTRDSLKQLAKSEISKLEMAPSSALKSELHRMLIQHETGSVNWSLGGNDLNTAYGINLWTVDMLWVRRPDFGNAYQDDEIYIKALNSWFLANDLFDSWLYLQQGALDHMRSYQGSLDATDVFPDIFTEQQADLVHAYKVLVNLYRTRLANNRQSNKACYSYSDKEIAEKWRSFSADNKLNLNRTMQVSYSDDFVPYATATIDNYRKAMLGSFSDFAKLNSTLSKNEIKQIEDKISQENRVGLIPKLILDELDSIDSSGKLSEAYQAINNGMVMVGGEDSAFSDDDFQKLWLDVKTFIEAESGLGQDILNDTVVLQKDERGAYTDSFGQIFFGLKKQRSIAEVLAILMHEAHHAIARKLNQQPSGLLILEGAATFTQDFMMNKAFAAILPKYDTKTPALFYAAAALKNIPYSVGLAEATYLQYLNQDCSMNSTDKLNKIFGEKYGVLLSDDPKSEGPTLQAASGKVNEGTLQLSYSIGAVRYAGIFNQYQSEITEFELNPYLLQTCGVAFMEEPTAADIATVRDCVKKLK